MANESNQPQTFVAIQILRAIAALGVVYTHCASEGGFNNIKNTGAWGVDIFFIISGFIIAYIVSKDTSRFIVKRIFRVVPLYYIATFLVILVALCFPSLIHGTKITIEKIIKSLFFIPYRDELKKNLPILGQGWTLSFEMFFYMTMAFCLFLIKNKKYLVVFCSFILIVFLVVLNVFKPSSFELEYYRTGLFPEFIYGLLLFPVYDCIKQKINITSTYTYPPSPPVYIKIFCLGIVIICFTYLIRSDITGLYFSKNRNLQNGIPSLILVVALLAMENYINIQNIIVKFMVLLGEASYTMYLFHYHITAFFSRVVFPRIVGNNNIFIVEILKLLFTIISTIIISIYLYKLVDMPIQKKLRRLIKK
jgi:peptidoglycan/LPS O-acetylase OafA/YrhL